MWRILKSHLYFVLNKTKSPGRQRTAKKKKEKLIIVGQDYRRFDEFPVGEWQPRSFSRERLVSNVGKGSLEQNQKNRPQYKVAEAAETMSTFISINTAKPIVTTEYPLINI